MAGGIGSRFWPFSRNNKPKQFLDFFGTGQSLLQLTYERFRKLMPAEHIFIASSTLYKDLILEQLPEITQQQVLLEPIRRNTAPCVAYAVNRIAAMTDKANIIVAPSDHLILNEGNFIETLEEGLKFVEEKDCLLTLGMNPTRPETGYGYIQISEGSGCLRKVKTFTEKPDLELAKVFLESGEFFWNAGIFLWNMQSILSAFDRLLPETAAKFRSGKEFYNTKKEQEFIDNIYPSCENISIDYGILEKADNVYVLCAEFGWSDLGTWGSLHELASNKDEHKYVDEHQNVTLKCESLFYDCKDNIVVLPENKLAVLQGLEGYIVVEADDVLLVCKKDEEQRIRQFVNDIAIRFKGEFI